MLDDDANIVTLRQTDQGSDQLVPAKTTWTLLLYLTSSSEGWYVPFVPVCPDSAPAYTRPLGRHLLPLFSRCATRKPSGNSDCRSSNGGETVFYPFDRRSAKEEIAVSPETGMLLLHKHGNDCLLVCSPPRPDVCSSPGLPNTRSHARQVTNSAASSMKEER